MASTSTNTDILQEGEWLSRLAPAKINLFLHITGRDNRGYHTLESLFVFADIGDRVRVRAAKQDSFHCVGPFAEAIPNDGSNLVLKAAQVLRERAKQPSLAADMHLEKNLPVAAGIGGGSSDAAATLVLLNHLWNLNFTAETLKEIAFGLGADVPSCLDNQPKFVKGVGEAFETVKLSPPKFVILINDGVRIFTKDIFNEFALHNNPFSASISSEGAQTIEQIESYRNDLSLSAFKFNQGIQEILAQLQAFNTCQLARMSGSGGTCFALFEDRDQAETVASDLQSRHPNWWISVGCVFDSLQ